MNKRSVLYKIGLLLGGGLFLYQIVKAILETIKNGFTILAPIYLLVAFGLVLLSTPLQIVTWKILMSGGGYSLKFVSFVEGFTLSFLPRYIPGSVWGFISRGEWLFQKHKIPYRATGLVSILEILVALVSAVIWIGLPLGKSISLFIWLGTSVTLVLAIWLIFRYGGKTPLQKFTSFPNGQPITLSCWTGGVVSFFLQWAILGMVVFFILRSINPMMVQPDPLQISLVAIKDYVIAWVVGFIIIFVPAGFGFREGVLTFLLTTTLNVDAQTAVIVAILSRLWISLAELAWLGTGMVINRFLLRNNP